MSAPVKAAGTGSPLVKRPIGKGMKKGPGVAGGAPPKATPGFNTIRGALKRNSTVAPGGGEGVPQWLRVQIAIYSRFVEQRLAHAGIKDVKITNVLEDVSSGKVLAQLLEVLSGQKYAGKLSEKELGRIQAMSQVSDVLKWMEGTLKVDLKRCSPEDVVDKKDKAVFGMLYSVILKFVKLDEEDDAGGVDVREAMKIWFTRRTHGYNLDIKDLKGSTFADGMVLCALIHRMRPRLIDYESLSAENKEENLTLAFEQGEAFCNVPVILEAADIATLDEVSVCVWAFDWYYAVSLLAKQDIAARRIGKLVNMTKLHDKMRADYTTAAEKTSTWVDEKVAFLNGIAFDNTLAGIRAQLQQVSDYKTGEKSSEIAANLENDSLFQNLAVRLTQAARPPFSPAGLCPTDIEKKLETLDQVEAQVAVKMQAELSRQLNLQKLHQRFKKSAKKLTTWVETEKTYADAVDQAALTEEAQANIWNFTVHHRDVTNARLTRLKDLAEAKDQLEKENFEKKAEVAASYAEVAASFDALDAALTSKKAVLDADLKREEGKDDAACTEFASLSNDFTAFTAKQKSEMQESAAKELEDQLVLIDAQIAVVKGAAESKVAAISAAQQAIETRAVSANPHTTLTVDDVKATHAQLTTMLAKKRELIQARLEEKKQAGLSEEMMKEIGDNFDFFDRNKSGSIDEKELRQCLASLGEDSNPVEVKKILDEFDTNKNGKISREEFTAFMKLHMGDSNTEEEIVTGWKLIALEQPKCPSDRLRVLVNDVAWRDEHVAYLLTEQTDVPFPEEEGIDYTAWTAAVFKR